MHGSLYIGVADPPLAWPVMTQTTLYGIALCLAECKSEVERKEMRKKEGRGIFCLASPVIEARSRIGHGKQCWMEKCEITFT